MTALRRAAALTWLVGTMMAVWPVSWCSRALTRWVMARVWATGLLRVAGVRWRITFEPDALPLPARAVLVANHASILDIPLLSAALRRPPRFVAKVELGRVPLLGHYMRRSEAVLVDRRRPREAARVLDVVVERIEAGNPYCFFAEGTRSEDGHVHRFRAGAFQAALRAKAAVIPVAIVGSGDSWPPGAWGPGPARVEIRVGAAVRPSEGESSGALSHRVRAAVGALHLKAGGKGLAPDMETGDDTDQESG